MSSNDRSDLSDFTDDFGDVSAGFLSGAISEGSALLSNPEGALDSAESEGEDILDGSSGDSTTSGGSAGSDIEILADMVTGTEPVTPAATDATHALTDTTPATVTPALTDTAPGPSEPASGPAVVASEPASTDTAQRVVASEPALTDAGPGPAVVASEPALTDTAPRVDVPVGLERSLDDMGPSLQVPGGEHALSHEGPGLAEHVGVSENREAPVVDDTQVREPRVESSATDESPGASDRGEGPVDR